LLTGSSARKLKKVGVNLLAGRARQAELFPLTFHEILNFDLSRYLQYGGLPMIYLSDEPIEDLDAYVYTYLEQEIKAASTARFYYFDIGVKNKLAKITALSPKTDLFGQAFEHFIALELRAYLSYTRNKLPLCFWRTVQGYEVDFILGDEVAIEVKSSEKISDKHLKSLNYLSEENKLERYYMVSQDPIVAKYGKIIALPWEQFLKQLWAGEIL
jgi:predicted AAA+ superfamily ATPase